MATFEKRTSNIPLWSFLLVLTTLVVNCSYFYARFNTPIDGAGSQLIGDQCVITAIQSGSPADMAGLEIGDTISQIEHIVVTGGNHQWMLQTYRPGDIISYQIVRNDKELEVFVPLGSYWSQYPVFYMLLYLVILLIFLTSIYILYKKPFDPSVRVFFVYLQLFAVAQNTRFLFIAEPYATFATIIFIFSFNLFGIALLHFHLIFPEPVRWFNNIKTKVRIIYGFGILLSIILSVFLILRNYVNIDYAIPFGFIARWSIAWMGLSLFLALVTAIYRYRVEHDVRVRKQLRLVVAGSVIGLATPILFSIYPEFFWNLETRHHLVSIVEFSNAFGSYIMIIFLSLAIFRYRLWDIENVVKKIILYLAIASILLLFYSFMLFLVDRFAVGFSRPLHFLILAAAVISLFLLKEKLQGIIDRLFYREPYNSETVIEAFEKKVAGYYQPAELKEKILKGLDDIFHPLYLNYFQNRNKSDYVLAGSLGTKPISEEQLFTASVKFNQLLLKSRVFSTEEVQQDVLHAAYATQADLVIPLVNNGIPLGFIIAGPRKSERSYTLKDIRLFSVLAHRIVALFNTAELYRKDLDRQLYLERERSRIAEDMHDDLGASLTRISMLSELTMAGSEESEKKQQWLSQISETSRKVMQDLSQIIWALNPKNDSLEGLASYIRRFVYEFLEPSDIKYTIDFPWEIYPCEIRVETRRNIYLILKEALHNIVKHSGASEVTLKLQQTGQGFIITIQDNGCGFDPANLNYTGNGLANMKKRTQEIGGNFDLQSTPGSGTQLQITISAK